MNDELFKLLDEMFPNPICELEYNKDYELLIATMLSAQSTDKRVNMVTKNLFKYNLKELSELDNNVIENIIRPVGTFRRKTEYIKAISKAILRDYSGMVPNDRKYLETLPGVGRKTVSVVLANIYNEPTIAVDTHVERVSNVLGLVSNEHNILKIEKKLMKNIPREKWNRVNDQLVLFGRYICKAKKQDCENCLFRNNCKKK